MGLYFIINKIWRDNRLVLWLCTSRKGKKRGNGLSWDKYFRDVLIDLGDNASQI